MVSSPVNAEGIRKKIFKENIFPSQLRLWSNSLEASQLFFLLLADRSSLCPLLNFSAVRLLLTIDEIMKWSVGRGPENIHSLSIIFSFVFSSVWTAGMVELGKDRRKKLTLSSTPSQVP